MTIKVVMGGYTFTTLENATNISMRSSTGLMLELSVRMPMEILSPFMIRKPIASCLHFLVLLMMVTMLPGLEQRGVQIPLVGGILVGGVKAGGCGVGQAGGC